MTLGLMATLLGVIARMFGMREGLLREHQMLERVRRSPVLEIGGIVGMCVMASGLYVGVDLVAQWGSKDFGELQQGAFLRSVSLSTLLLTFGGIGFLTSLIMGFLALPTRRSLE
jgi:hypothetical protein